MEAIYMIFGILIFFYIVDMFGRTIAIIASIIAGAIVAIWYCKKNWLFIQGMANEVTKAMEKIFPPKNKENKNDKP